MEDQDLWPLDLTLSRSTFSRTSVSFAYELHNKVNATSIGGHLDQALETADVMPRACWFYLVLERLGYVHIGGVGKRDDVIQEGSHLLRPHVTCVSQQGARRLRN